jgi:hypothetical protein
VRLYQLAGKDRSSQLMRVGGSGSRTPRLERPPSSQWDSRRLSKASASANGWWEDGVYDEVVVVARFGDAPEPALREQVAKTLDLKEEVLANDVEEEIGR